MKENKKGLAVAGFICSAVGLFVYPWLGILGIIFGGITLSANEKEEGMWKKVIWKYENKALAFGVLSLIWGILDIIWLFLRMF